MDEDGYPSEETLERIRTWEIKGDASVTALMEFVHSLWAYESWGWHKEKRRIRPWPGAQLVRRYRISTAGWSGNESLIDAMETNQVFWMMSWYSIRRGGHYEFHIREE
jgi:hypothetical protein